MAEQVFKLQPARMTSLESCPEKPMKHKNISLASFECLREADDWHVVRFEANRALRGCARSLPTQHTGPRGAHPRMPIFRALTHNIKRLKKSNHPSVWRPTNMPRQTAHLTKAPMKTRSRDMQPVQPRLDTRSHYVIDTIHSM
jgi:hypothetical protein